VAPEPLNIRILTVGYDKNRLESVIEALNNQNSRPDLFVGSFGDLTLNT
jgi:hypothetical protein